MITDFEPKIIMYGSMEMIDLMTAKRVITRNMEIKNKLFQKNIGIFVVYFTNEFTESFHPQYRS